MIFYYGSFSENGAAVFEENATVKAISGNVTLLVQGLLHGTEPAALLRQYQERGTFDVASLDGSFTLLLFDPERRTALLYRHLVGGSFTYYAPTENGFSFGSNLATVARRCSFELQPNEAALPGLFLYRFVTGRETLFQEIFRLQPGELVTWHDGRWSREQRVTLHSFIEPQPTDEAESIDRVEAALDASLGDWQRLRPQSAVLLSGGVDSMILQAHWNTIWRQHHVTGDPPSVAVVLNHPYTKPDLDYTMSAVAQLGTAHLNIMQEPLTAAMMSDIIGYTGEMPNHVQSFFFATLATGMSEAGFQGGICGEGADGLFGNDGPDFLMAAKQWGQRIPSAPIRCLLAWGIERLHLWPHLPPLLRLAGRRNDLDYLLHPQNMAAAFTDLDQLADLFSPARIHGAMRQRRSLLDAVRVPCDDDGLHRALLMGYFGEGVNTAAYWTSMFQLHGLDLYNPFLDSRLLRAAINIQPEAHFVMGNPKQVLKKSLARHVPEAFIRRPKLGFGQPIFEWLAPGGGLREAVKNIGDYPWLTPTARQRLLDRPAWPLWTLLCYDLWYKIFINR